MIALNAHRSRETIHIAKSHPREHHIFRFSKINYSAKTRNMARFFIGGLMNARNPAVAPRGPGVRFLGLAGAEAYAFTPARTASFAARRPP